jgi:rhomboid protease GluP
VAAEVPTEAVVRASPDRGQAEGISLVLESVAIPHRVVLTEAGGYAVLVPPRMVAPAIAALEAHDRETAEGPPRESAAPNHGSSLAGVAMTAVLGAFFAVTGPSGGDVGGWFRKGSAIAESIVRDHELWRAVTALTLHRDIIHIAGNAVATLVFVTALGRWLGAGLALLATLLAGAAGNLATAFFYTTGHNSVGASTATFGALGLLGGLQFVRRFRDSSVGRLRRALLSVAAALGLLAMLGIGDPSDLMARTGGRPDVMAHATGLGFGVLGGVAIGVTVRRPVRSVGQAVCVAATTALLCGAWILAFHLDR